MEINKVRMIVCIALLSVLIPLGYIHARRDVNQEENVIQQDSESEVDVLALLGFQMDAKSKESHADLLKHPPKPTGLVEKDSESEVDVLGLQMDAKSEESSGGNAAQPKSKKAKKKVSRRSQARSVNRLSKPRTRPSKTTVPKRTGTRPSETKVPKRTGPERMIVIILGPPGAGKGTHAGLIAGVLGITHLSTGDMFRAMLSKAEELFTPTEKQIKQFMDAGQKVPNATVVGLVKDRVDRKFKDVQAGFLLDGFPRTLIQAEELVKMLAAQGEKISLVIDLHVPDEVLEERICGRWTHKASGRGYHAFNPEKKFLPPKSYLRALETNPSALPKCDLTETGEIQDCNMLDDDTNEPLSQRSDDNAEALKTRLQGFHDSFDPITTYLRKKALISEVSGDQEMDKVCGAVFTQIRAIARTEGHKVRGQPVPDSFGKALAGLATRDPDLAARLRKKCISQTKAQEAEAMADDYDSAILDDDFIAAHEDKFQQAFEVAFHAALSNGYKGTKVSSKDQLHDSMIASVKKAMTNGSFEKAFTFAWEASQGLKTSS